jgi:glycosyltransferase involved in cell wall biosynthesis
MIQVLLGTYNGEKYLKEQIDSILGQSIQQQHQLLILIRDDGSSDGTLNILAGYQDKLEWETGENIGIVANYFELLKRSSDKAEYVAFSDQDDIWLPPKLERAVKCLSALDPSVPSMYCSRTILMKGSNEVARLWPSLDKPLPSLNNALVQNIAVGCTIVINKTARDLLVERLPEPARIIMHDWWIYLTISAFGKVIFDPEAYILYRQHGSNAIGASNTFRGEWKRRLARFQSWDYGKIHRQAKLFHDLFVDRLEAEQRVVIMRFLDYPRTFAKRFRYAWSTEIYRQTALENMLLKWLIISGRL